MRILFVSDTYYPHINGVYFFVCRIASLLQDKGHLVAVIAPSETLSFPRKRVDNIEVYGVPSIPTFYYRNFRLPLSFLLRARIDRILHDFKPDIIHIQDHLLIAKTVVKASKNTGVPVIGTNHFMPENLTALFHSENLKRGIERFSWSQFSVLFNQLALVTTPTETAAQLIRPKLKVPVTAISSGIDLAQFNSRADAGEIRRKYSIPDKPVLLYVGRIDPEKHIDEVLQAVALVVKDIDLCFVVTGKGLVKSNLERLADSLGIADRVIFTGFVPEEELPVIYKLSRCFIIASIAELLSLATLQAMASGLPIIAANAGALPELVHGNGYLFNPGDIQTMAIMISKIFTQDDLHQKEMSEKSLQYVVVHDINRVVLAFEKIYKRSLTKKYGYLMHNVVAN